MKRVISTYLLLLGYLCGFSQVPSNDECSNAIEIADARNYCSEVLYTNENATPSYTGNDKDVWFKFVARNFEIKITVNGTGGTGALLSPVIKVYNNCGNNVSLRVAPSVYDGNTTIFNDAGLIPGQTYYIAVSGSAGGTGSFSICIENYQSEIKPGQDFVTASLLCSTESIIREVNVSGSGADPNETSNTCIGEEKHSAWYKWTAANDGTLVFTITPTQNDDIDWVLFELGPEGNAELPSVSNMIRCAAGHGINNDDCPEEPTYTQTGLDFGETDIIEEGNCGSGQNGLLKVLTMKEGYVYALVVNNFSEGNNGFELAFTDKAGKAGTGLFKGPTGKINYSVSNECTPQQYFTFTTDAENYDSINWYFGEDADIDSLNTYNPPPVRYLSPGLKTVVLRLKSNTGCSVVETLSFEVGISPENPVIQINKDLFCISDTMVITPLTQENNVGYLWTGPAGFTSTDTILHIPVNSKAVSGVYTLILTRDGCSSGPVSITVPPVSDKPVAAFSASPPLPSKLAYPVTVQFNNQSQHADSYHWDFGDGDTSTEENPEHTYTGAGNYSVTLTAFNLSSCEASITHGTFMISMLNAIFIPNTFTPNNDTVNDRFEITINNILRYQIRIYNRYGVLLYVSDNPIESWDGTYKNEPVPAGTYYYILDATDMENNTVRKSGSVTVLR